ELTGQAAQLGEAVRIISESAVRENSQILQLPDWLPLPSKRRKRWAIRTLDTLIWDIIRERRASGGDRGDLLSMLLLAVDEEGDGRGMTDQQARDEAMTLFNAGHDSTAAGLAWIWYLLVRHPAIQEPLAAEARQVLGDRAATWEDVPKLTQTHLAVKEALRLYPPTWALIVREAITEVELGGYSIRRGGWVFLLPWVLHHDPRWFPEPDRFDPQRFAPGRVEQIPQYAYLPFGAGPHICIGQLFAPTEMVLIVATILQHFRLEAAPG